MRRSGLVLILPLLVGGSLRSSVGAGAGAGDGSSGDEYMGADRTGSCSSTLMIGVEVLFEGGEEAVADSTWGVVLTPPSETPDVLDAPSDLGMKGFCVKFGIVLLCVNPLRICHFIGD